ncbi:MAG TPA: DNA repair protein RecN [Methylomirabilota bacterium]|nr:DNA repair protein RecN [Methylomirabilota bacterium]
MLRELRIRNFAVVENVTVVFAPGLNVLTGETGAGKSILIDALLLLCGARAQTDVIRTDADAATVEAVFELPKDGRAVTVLRDAGIEAGEGEVVVRRELTRAGRHRAFVNDSVVTVALLERLGEHVLDVHGQHEHQRLLEPLRQLELLDRFADVEELTERVADLFAKFRVVRDELERTRRAERDRVQREDLLRFQVSELDAARLRIGEEHELRAERRRLQHAEKFAAGLAEVTSLLDDEPQSVRSGLARALRVLADLGRIDAGFAATAEGLEAARIQVEDTLATVRELRKGLADEPGRLEAIDDRLDAIGRLKRKYGDSEEAMLRHRDDAAAELDRLARHDEVMAAQERMVGELSAELTAAAGTLSERRSTAATRLAARAEKQLRALGMDRAVFRIAVERAASAEMSSRGLDRVEFALAANPGEELRPLARVASGGELSRTMLALEAVLARADRVPTLIFDEVDAGIGARVAATVGETLAAAADGRQVLCVTHLAPIAALAQHHLTVTKSVRGGRTRATVAALGDGERVVELARMLGGEGGSAAALRHARELLAGRRKARSV